MTAVVAIVGGGYGGVTLAKSLDDVAEVVLIEQRDTFAHNVAALRAVANPSWAARLFVPYDRLLARGRVLRGRAVAVSPSAVTLASGTVVTADYVVLASGSTHRYPAKIDVLDSAAGIAKLRGTHDQLALSPRVLLLGAGPVGLELAGEIKATWPGKAVTIIDRGAELMPGAFPEEFRTELRAQLAALGVSVRLGTSLRDLPPGAPGQAGEFTVTTASGTAVTADIWFACYGAAPAAGYLTGELRGALRPDGHVAVTPQLRVAGQSAVFAIGDITALPEQKMARAAQKHAEVVAANIRALISGGEPRATYQPAPDAIVLPLGPEGGVTYAPGVGVLGAGPTAQLKSGHLFVHVYQELLGAQVPAK
jgi:NADH dehydrogenase FAD-containing subunit